jgi:hypothetical protein
MTRYITHEERIDVGRASFELEQQYGRNAHKAAAKRVARALAANDAEQAQFWKWVEAALRPRSGTEHSN